MEAMSSDCNLQNNQTRDEKDSKSSLLSNDETIAKDASNQETFDVFYDEVKAIEHRDSVLTCQQQLDRLTRPGATYFNLNPFDVLQIDPDSPLADVKKKYRMLSILVHPDKNLEDSERARKCFEAVNKAYKTLENEEGLLRCTEIVQEARSRTTEMVKQKKKQLKKEGKLQIVPEDLPTKFKHAVYVHTCKLFADLERLRQESEMKDMHNRKRKAEEEVLEKEKMELEKIFKKNYEDSRTDRVDSWRSWKKGSKKSKGFRPPKVKTENR